MAEGQRGWREIFATQGEVDGVPTLRVYQAYNERIATSAAAANSFAAPQAEGSWRARTSWVKPSAAWMAYRCGWSMLKDPNQARVLALDLDRRAFLALLMEAGVAHPSEGKGGSKGKPVVVQWDPERSLDPTQVGDPAAPFLRPLPGVRSLQVGLRPREEEWLPLADPLLVRRIRDVTESFRAAHAALRRGELAAARAALWPTEAQAERRVHVPEELRQVLQMSASPPQELQPRAQDLR